MPHTHEASQATALSFVRHLTNRAYDSAYAMTAHEYQAAVSLEQMREAFQDVIPDDWGAIGPIEVGQTMEGWPHKGDSDLMWIYVSIGGDVYSEAVTLVVTVEDEELRVRDIQFGRP